MDDARNGEWIRSYYARGEEHDRLSNGAGIVEYERTTEIIRRHLPDEPCDVADIGCGPGRYCVWLAELGHRVSARDPIQLHVEQTLDALEGRTGVDVRVGEARSLDLGDASMDAVLLLGPLYHLPDRGDRVSALVEARRVVRPGGVVIAAVISRWAARLDGVLTKQNYVNIPATWESLLDAEDSGHFRPVHESSFTAFTHRPAQIRDEVAEARLELVDLVNVEGPTILISDLDARMADPLHRSVVLESARALEHVEELMGVGAHMLAIAHRPI